jgi:alpha-tubulin suppressor-like RCC1 family protein
MSWGENAYGTLGDGMTGGLSDVPVSTDLSLLTPGTTVTSVAAGEGFSLGLLSDGNVIAWGVNSDGQLGDGSFTSDSDVPVEVSGLADVTAIAAGGAHSLALLSDGKVMSWGLGARGALGDGSMADSDVPVEVGGLSDVVGVSAGGGAGTEDSLAVLADGTVMAWGSNLEGLLGDGHLTGPQSCSGQPCSTTPSPVTGLDEAVSVSSGANNSLALLNNGTVMAWGSNAYGDLGDGNSSGPETCEGGPCSSVPLTVSGLHEATAIAAGGSSDLALLNNETVVAWGNNYNGQLGDGTNTGPQKCDGKACSTTPIAVSGLTNVAAIAAGYTHSLALSDNGTVWAWGSSGDGQLGNGTTGEADAPVEASGLTGAAALAAGLRHSTAVVVASGPAPAVKKLSPKAGAATGGTLVKITGTGFTGVTTVRFGSVRARRVTVTSSTSITAEAPAESPGTVYVRVYTPNGESAIASKAHFKFKKPKK